jgi:hypothetical protein
MSEPQRPEGLRLMKVDDEGNKITTPLTPRYVGRDRNGDDLWEVVVPADVMEGASFLADKLPAGCAIRVRVEE